VPVRATVPPAPGAAWARLVPRDDAIIRKSDYQVDAADRRRVRDERAARIDDPVEEAARQWGRRYPDPAGFRALVSLVRGYGAVVREVEAILRPLELNISRFEVLLLLAFSRTGALPMMRIRDLLLVHGSSVTYLVDRLQEAGRVERADDPDDGRVSLVRLTDEGRRVIDRAARALADGGFGSFGALGDGDLERLSQLLGALRREPDA
jgi:DNA-binding MarR family transcriptional regulator